MKTIQKVGAGFVIFNWLLFPLALIIAISPEFIDYKTSFGIEEFGDIAEVIGDFFAFSVPVLTILAIVFLLRGSVERKVKWFIFFAVFNPLFFYLSYMFIFILFSAWIPFLISRMLEP